jgi:hypothetical protein
MWDRRAQGGWDGLDQLAGRDNTFDAVEEADTLLMTVLGALSTCWIEVAMARDKAGVLVVTP